MVAMTAAHSQAQLSGAVMSDHRSAPSHLTLVMHVPSVWFYEYGCGILEMRCSRTLLVANGVMK